MLWRRLTSLLEDVILTLKATGMLTNSFLTNKNRIKSLLNFQTFKDDRLKLLFHVWCEEGKDRGLSAVGWEDAFVSSTPELQKSGNNRYFISLIYLGLWKEKLKSLKVLPQYSHDQKYWQSSSLPGKAWERLEEEEILQDRNWKETNSNYPEMTWLKEGQVKNANSELRV